MRKLLLLLLISGSLSAHAHNVEVSEAMARTIGELPFSTDINADRWQAERSLSRTMRELKQTYPREELRGQLKKTSCVGEGRSQKCVSWEIVID